MTLSGVFFKIEMFVPRSPMSLADSSRSLATAVASLPVSFWMFCGGRLVLCAVHIVSIAHLDMGLDFDAKLL